MDFLKSAVASAIAKGPLAPYVVGDRVDQEDSIWTLNNATKRDDGSPCSIFSFDVAARRKHLPLAKNALRKCRTLRHPGVIKVLDTSESDYQLHIITERLTPLAAHVRKNALTEEAMKWGLWNIAKTVSFINNEAASIHACLRLASVFTSESGEWKLGGLEVLSATADEEGMVHAHTGLVPNYGRLMPPEVVKGGWGTYRQNPWPAVDAYGYANLISEIYNGPASGPGQTSELHGFPPSMQQSYKRLLNPNPKGRLAVSGFLDQGRRPGAYFQTPLISLAVALDSLGLKSDGEREEFLSDLQGVAEDFPEEYLKHKILPELLKSVEFGGGGPKVFAMVLKIAAKLSEDDYTTLLLPVIVRLFANPDRALRVFLLDSLPLMIDHLPKATVNDKIFPNIVTGFSDLAPLVREQTVKSVLTIITKLSDRVINGELLKQLAKTANDAEPGIRTNTTICLGKIAKHLGPSTRTKVLIAAFTRSLKDPFVHGRNAGVMALGATSEMFTEDDCATKILPALCSCLLDKEKIVRDQANKALDVYISRVRKHAQTMPDTALPPPSTGSASAANGAPRMGSPAVDNSWTGWAISSFTNKLSTADGSIQPSAKAASNGATTPLTRPDSAAANAASTRPVQLSSLSRQRTDSNVLAQSFARPETAAKDDFWDETDNTVDAAWGAMDDGDGGEDTGGWDHDAADSTAAASNDSTAAPRSTTSRATAFEDNGEPDFAGWLKAQQSAKTKKAALPKGLASKTVLPTAASRPAGSAQGKAVPKPVKPAVPVKATNPKDDAADDDWGDAWA